ncbi:MULTISPECIES: BolA family protein [Xanthomonas]|uniref:BolA family transcriptional regulator n=3 Tax=Xanthomonas TaxID=338 RepID=A0A9X4H2Z7_9XANT|nr:MULTISPECIES: BolA family protein [Xanthomonas]MCE4356014.1 BolA family transcriptional regulator [Xanthomonas hortorum pv. pelargonii]MCE4371699.1 BolA family transcriptional regulator [Xanthomonas hortorum pv. hederae]MCM5524410.1 BolA family transcriptional regulator [Xanthomonas hortorum pv. pelargonii]MCM5536625.1 BolA family transcriptional regulator [Xanthomonas hortorum pv. pelargonii]MCM5540810.1 BolA family transcriptional regulator [Xanthomonas hortorum pv. pelargonii]
MSRVERIRAALQSALAPSELEVVDDSHRHAGHAGARDGRGHFNVRVVSAAFVGKAPLARHRAVYAAVGEMMQTDIHALSIEAFAPGEAG